MYGTSALRVCIVVHMVVYVAQAMRCLDVYSFLVNAAFGALNDACMSAGILHKGGALFMKSGTRVYVCQHSVSQVHVISVGEIVRRWLLCVG